MNAAQNSQNSNTVALTVHIQPKASVTEYAGLYNGAHKIRVKAQPIDGKANHELIVYLAKSFAVPKCDVEIAHGHTSRLKKILIRNPGQIPEWINGS